MHMEKPGENELIDKNIIHRRLYTESQINTNLMYE